MTKVARAERASDEEGQNVLLAILSFLKKLTMIQKNEGFCNSGLWTL